MDSEKAKSVYHFLYKYKILIAHLSNWISFIMLPTELEPTVDFKACLTFGYVKNRVIMTLQLSC